MSRWFTTCTLLGWADVSFHGSPQIPTPNLDALASDGVVLNNYYVHPTCTASRGALMTGLYSTRYGLQHIPIQPGEPYGLDLKYTLLPQHLKRLGYETHLIGKWHLGSYRYEYTPTRRGFDSFYGFYYGHEDYYTHMLHHSQGGKQASGLDLWDGTNPARDAMGVYGTELFTKKAVHLIENLDKSKPQFLYLSHQAPHSGNYDDPLQAQKKNVRKFPYIGEHNRTVYAGMVDSLDEAVGSVVRALGEAGMLQDSVIVFSADNGGVPWGYMASRGINWPLRGAKSSPWEGGSRAAAFVWSPLLDKRRRVSEQLMHITDWLPTFYALAGGSTSDLGQLDGLDMWGVLSRDEPSQRSDVVYNIDPLWDYAAIRRDNFKIVVGSRGGGKFDQRFPIPGGQRPSPNLEELMERSLAAQALRALYGKQDLGFAPDWRANTSLSCLGEQCGDQSCFQSADNVFLFDMDKDPCECNNLASTHKQVLDSMNKVLEEYRAQTVPPIKPAVDPASFPENHDGTWAPWVD
ncbi:arylsulfatase B isoform X2 [Rhipicephalus sanguineus]|uniref:arylsulfatase B isoform X2 n=1 Tax=Rhipicephalus sanguineus TaxID=34632 RepID=UPI0020C3A70F|nr:arylsulfatase B isoform X2 [Rhipicephalus sanguineus]